MNTLHIYGPEEWHFPAKLIGTKEAFIHMRNSLNKIIDENKKTTHFESFCSDGEGFDCEIYCLSDEEMNNQDVPYTHYE